jgi:hypothetical protein
VTAGAWSDRFDAIEACYGRAGGASRPVEYSLAGRALTIAAASDEASTWLERPLRHLAGGGGGQPLRVDLGHGAEPELEPLWKVAPARGDEPTVRPRLALGDGREIVGGLWPDVGMVGLLHRARGRAILWVRDLASIPPADAATLFRALVAWWLPRPSYVVVHAAAVAGLGGAALLVGRGGAGKSGTATACFEAGLSFLGDDSVLCRPDEPAVFSLSGCASLLERDVDRYHPQLSQSAARKATRDGKIFVDLAATRPQRVATTAPLRALVRLTIDHRATRLERIPRSRALKALAPSSLFNVPTLDPLALGSMASLARALPAYELTLSGDRGAAARLVTELLENGDAR